jgi:hypothetical protein
VFATSLDEAIAVEIERPSEEVWAFVSARAVVGRDRGASTN